MRPSYENVQFSCDTCFIDYLGRRVRRWHSFLHLTQGQVEVRSKISNSKAQNFLIRHSKDTKNKLYPIRKFDSLEEISISLIIYLDIYLFLFDNTGG